MSNDGVPDGTFPPDFPVEMRVFDGVPVHLYVRAQLADYPGLQQNAKLSVHKMQHIANMVATLTSWCVAGMIPSDQRVVTVEWPDGPWQAFKLKYAPEWFKRRYPVKMAHEDVKSVVNHYFVCPHLQTPEPARHIQFMATGTRMAQWMHPR